MAGDEHTNPLARFLRAVREGLWRPLALALLFVGLFLNQIVYLITVVWEEERYSHGFLIPVVSLFYLYLHRERFASAERRPSNVGLMLLVPGLLGWMLAQAATFNALAHLSMLLLLAGMVAFTAGWKYLRLSAFPIVYLIFAFPVPEQLDKQNVVGPLQTFASIVAEKVIDLFGIPVDRLENVIEVPDMQLAVEEACSGINSLYSLLALGVAYVFLTDRSNWMRTILIFSTVPIAIVANVFRVSLTGILAVWVSPKTAYGFFHTFSGLLVFLLGLGLFLLFAAFLNWLTSPEDPEDLEDAVAEGA